jgi:hypothetical protein
MKHFLFTCCCLLSLSAAAQVYHAFPDSNASWSVFHHYQSSPTNFQGWTEYYRLDGDTVIGPRAYHKLYKDQQCLGGIRNDVSTKSVYFSGIYNSNTIADTLLYRFGMNVGDTVPVTYRPMADTPPGDPIHRFDLHWQWLSQAVSYV